MNSNTVTHTHTHTYSTPAFSELKFYQRMLSSVIRVLIYLAASWSKGCSSVPGAEMSQEFAGLNPRESRQGTAGQEAGRDQTQWGFIHVMPPAHAMPPTHAMPCKCVCPHGSMLLPLTSSGIRIRCWKVYMSIGHWGQNGELACTQCRNSTQASHKPKYGKMEMEGEMAKERGEKEMQVCTVLICLWFGIHGSTVSRNSVCGYRNRYGRCCFPQGC